MFVHACADPSRALPVRPGPARFRSALRRRMLLLAAGCTLLPLAAKAAPALTRDPALTFPVLLQQALRHSPDYLALAPRSAEAQAQLAAARSWLAGRPALEAGFVSDRLRSDTGATELEYGVNLPLRRPGERRDAARLAAVMGQEADAWRSYLELTLAGRLREALATLASADRVVALEGSAIRDAQQLVETVERLFTAGEATALDVAQAHTALLTQRRQALEAEAALARAEAAYVWLTGLSARPAGAHQERLAERLEITPGHPWLGLLAASTAVAEGHIQRARAAARGNPAVAVGGRRERGARGESHLDSVVLGLSVPFGGSAHVDVEVSSAKRLKAEAEVALRTAERELRQQLEAARREQATLGSARQLAEQQVALDRRQWEMANAAFVVGETTLLHVLSALRQYRASQREHELLSLRGESLTAQINQIVGVLP